MWLLLRINLLNLFGALDSSLKLNVDSTDSAVYAPQNTTRNGTTPCIPVGVSDTPVARRTRSSDNVDNYVYRMKLLVQSLNIMLTM